MKNRKSSFNQRLGKCYQLTGRYIMGNKNSILVHGTLHFQGKILQHAWIEENKQVYDLVLDQHYPDFIYYGMFHTKNLLKYTYKEAMRNMLRTKHFGDWRH